MSMCLLRPANLHTIATRDDEQTFTMRISRIENTVMFDPVLRGVENLPFDLVAQRLELRSPRLERDPAAVAVGDHQRLDGVAEPFQHPSPRLAGGIILMRAFDREFDLRLSMLLFADRGTRDLPEPAAA